LIPTLPPLSHERIGAEFDYSVAVTHANALFVQALQQCKDPLLRQHLKLRIKQIGQLCETDQPERQEKNVVRREQTKRRQKV
jgi:hypothetical protein